MIDWQQLSKAVSTFQSCVTIIAICVGAIWALIRFNIFRTLKPRLEFSFDFKCCRTQVNNMMVAIVGLKVINKGSTRIDLRKDSEPRCFLKYGLLGDTTSTDETIIISKSSEDLTYIDEVFTAHKWIEPDETIDEVKILQIPMSDWGVIQLEVEIFGEQKWPASKQKWAASAAFSLIDNAPVSSYASEDEQDEYVDSQPVFALLSTSVNKAKQQLKKSRLTEERKNELGELIDKSRSVLEQLSALRSREGIKIKMSEENEKLLTECKEYARRIRACLEL